MTTHPHARLLAALITAKAIVFPLTWQSPESGEEPEPSEPSGARQMMQKMMAEILMSLRSFK